MAIGLNVPEPEATCADQNCPFHGELAVRGQILEGEVASTDMEKTVIVEREYDVKVPKYDRYMKRRSRIPAHAPECLDLNVGDTVRIAETRPLSKTKAHVVVERISTSRQTQSGDAVETVATTEQHASGGVTEHSDPSGETTAGNVTEGTSGDRDGGDD